MAILCSFGTFFPVLVSCTKRNLATLSTTLFSPRFLVVGVHYPEATFHLYTLQCVVEHLTGL
jgi:hypothetical protein